MAESIKPFRSIYQIQVRIICDIWITGNVYFKLTDNNILEKCQYILFNFNMLHCSTLKTVSNFCMNGNGGKQND